MTYGTFLKFYMKFEEIKCQKLPGPDFPEKILFWGKSLKIPPKYGFMAFDKNLIYLMCHSFYTLQKSYIFEHLWRELVWVAVRRLTNVA